MEHYHRFGHALPHDIIYYICMKYLGAQIPLTPTYVFLIIIAQQLQQPRVVKYY